MDKDISTDLFKNSPKLLKRRILVSIKITLASPEKIKSWSYR